jgi:hypothetical protein
LEPQELYGYLWHAFPYSQHAKEAQEALALPHWSDPPTGVPVEGIILLADQGGSVTRRFGRNGVLLLGEQPVPPTVPSGWLCQDADLPDGWIGRDHRGEVEVLTRGDAADASPVSGVRHYVRVSPATPPERKEAPGE